jgi:hypothetical protein
VMFHRLVHTRAEQVVFTPRAPLLT